MNSEQFDAEIERREKIREQMEGKYSSVELKKHKGYRRLNDDIFTITAAKLRLKCLEGRGVSDERKLVAMVEFGRHIQQILDMIKSKFAYYDNRLDLVVTDAEVLETLGDEKILGNRTQAAKRLGITRSQLLKRLKEFRENPELAWCLDVLQKLDNDYEND